MANASSRMNNPLFLAQCQVAEIGSIASLLTIAAGSGDLQAGDAANIGLLVSRLSEEACNGLEALENTPWTQDDAAPSAVRFRRDPGAVVREATAVLRAAEIDLMNCMVGEERDRVERIAGLVDAALAVLQSMEGEGARHG